MLQTCDMNFIYAYIILSPGTTPVLKSARFGVAFALKSRYMLMPIF